MHRLCCVTLFVLASACAGKDSRLQYLANEGVAVFHEGTTVLFDPLFRIDYDLYASVPEDVRDAMLNGSPPFDNVAAVFVSHYHGDHFDPTDMLAMLKRHEAARLYAPLQAVEAMRQRAGEDDAPVFERITAIDQSYGDAPQSMQHGDIRIEAFFVPHTGWPKALLDVQNIAFRVTLVTNGANASVVHLGDADPNLLHFEPHAQEWAQHPTVVALPPYWFFNSTYGNDVLDQVVRPKRSIGIHVPAAFAEHENIPADLRDFDLFIVPGETRPLVIVPD